MNNEITTTAPAEEETHRNLYEIMFEFWETLFGFIKFLFYDLWIGNV